MSDSQHPIPDREIIADPAPAAQPGPDFFERLSRSITHGWGIFVALLVFCFFGAFVLEPLLGQVSGVSVQIWMAVAILALAAIGLHRMTRNKITGQQVIFLLFIAGLVVLAGYILYTPYGVRGHDIGDLTYPGHANYINIILNTQALPTSNMGQYYHPPLHHILSAIWAGGMQLFGMKGDILFEGVQWLTLFWAGMMMILSFRLLNQFLKPAKKAWDMPRILSAAVLFLHPTLMILAGSINNDILLWAMVAGTLLCLAQWMRAPSWKTALGAGIYLGLAMMTKTSAAMFALIVAGMMLYRLVGKKYRNYQRGRWWGMAVAAALIVIVLGFWHPIRQFIEFQQPFGYVARISTENPIYTGDVSLINRFLIIPGREFESIFCKPFEDANIIAYTLKCSVFGEYSYNGGMAAGIVLLWSNILMIATSLAAMVYVWIKDRREETRILRWVLSGTWVLMIISFIIFYLGYPFGCTMDFRYIVPTVLCGMGFIALAWQLWDENPRLPRWPQVAVGCLIGVFCVASVLFFLTI